jgi:hypothetical protein
LWGHPADTFVHIHLWTDNTAALSWLRASAATHPTAAFLMQVATFLQTLSSVTVTKGHLPGQFNRHADGASRAFQVPDGLRLQRDLCHLHPIPPSSQLMHAMLEVSATISPTGSWIAQHARIIAESMLGGISL